jgi:hypothetical protein
MDVRQRHRRHIDAAELDSGSWSKGRSDTAVGMRS